jgi:hypothetical protein
MLVVMAIAAAALVAPAGASALSPSPDDGEPEWLFTLNFGSAELTTGTDAQEAAQVTLERVDVDSLAFTDSPSRQVGLLPAGDLVDIINGASAAPLNAVLAARDPESLEMRQLVVELGPASFDDGTAVLTFEATVLGGTVGDETQEVDTDARLRAGYLFVDGVDQSEVQPNVQELYMVAMDSAYTQQTQDVINNAQETDGCPSCAEDVSDAEAKAEDEEEEHGEG